MRTPPMPPRVVERVNTIGGKPSSGTPPSLTAPTKPLGGKPITPAFKGITPEVQKNLMGIKAQGGIKDTTMSDTFKAPPSAGRGTFGQTLKTVMGSGMSGGAGRKRGGSIRGYD